MTAIRCDGTSRGAPVPISIDSVRKMYKGYDTVIGNFSFNGVVTSDAINKNFGTGNVIVQNANKGIIVYFGLSGIGLPDLGDSVTIDISGATLTKYAGALELKNIKPSKVNILAKNRYPAPITITIAALNANFSFYESVLVKIFNAKIAKAGNFSGSNTLSDATGNIILFTNSTATFANDAVQTISKTYQGIVTPYNTTNEIKIRNTTLDIY
jgi:hypothetical protein